MKIKTIICDLDGCLTDGHQYLSETGEKLFKAFHARDKTAIRRAVQSGIRVIVVSADDWDGARIWVESCGAEFMHRKIKVFDECADSVVWEETAGIGDDVIDLPFLEKCGLQYCPKDSLSALANDPFIEQLSVNGGKGVFAEALALIELHQKQG